MTTNTEPNQQALSEVLKEDEVGLSGRFHDVVR